MGGLARRAGLILERRKSGPSVLLLDSGDFFFRDQTLQQFELAQATRKAEILAQAAKIMGYSLVVPGESDLALGLTKYRELVKMAGMHPICANLKVGNELAFPATAMCEVGGLRVGFLGLLSVQRPLPQDQGKTLLVDNVVECCKAAVRSLSGKVDVIIALTHQGADLDRSMCRLVPGIDLIIGGHSRETLGSGTIIEKTAVYQAGYQGKYMGHVELKPARRDPGASKALRTPAERVISEAIPVDLSIKEDPKTAALVAGYNKWVTDEARKVSQASPQPTREDTSDVYWGATLCGQCHPKHDEFWKGTLHAHAFETLKKKNKTQDVECLACHTTGFAKTRNRPETKSITDVTGRESVQCESCHAPGSRHNTPEIRTRASLKATCVSCHDAKNSPKFDFETWLPRVRCPKGTTM